MTAQSEATPTPVSAKIKEWLGVAAAAATVAALVIAGMFGAIKLANAPLQADIQAIHGRLDRMEGEIKAGREETSALRVDMQNEFKAMRKEITDIRSDLAVLSERLARVETLLERGAGQPKPATTPEPE